MEPHGNTKRNDRLYIRTQHSTLDEIKENIGVMAPKAAIKDVYDKAGGIFICESLSEVPRDRWQAYNAKTRDHSMSNISSNTKIWCMTY